ncbi:MAG TPA: (d)CMP kinase [Acidimicrobiales bacterium]|nr:(d)CMP kinase [Acidimicrobiales bacterium]
MRVIAIDGPAGSGKSTVAKRVAEKLGLAYLDTGAMYRSVAFAALRRGLDVSDAEAVGRLAHQVEMEIGATVRVDGVDATVEIRGPDVTRAVSVVAANPDVRAEMVRRQRDWVSIRDGAVVEGRDIGSVVFPNAELKVFLTAGDEERARRRSQEMLDLDYDTVAADIARRDLLDSTRQTSPLVVAEDAVVIDTTGRSVEEIVEEVLAQL